MKFQSKENDTAREACKTERTKDIFGNACVFTKNAPNQNCRHARANTVK